MSESELVLKLNKGLIDNRTTSLLCTREMTIVISSILTSLKALEEITKHGLEGNQGNSERNFQMGITILHMAGVSDEEIAHVVLVQPVRVARWRAGESAPEEAQDRKRILQLSYKILTDRGFISFLGMQFDIHSGRPVLT